MKSNKQKIFSKQNDKSAKTEEFFHRFFTQQWKNDFSYMAVGVRMTTSFRNQTILSLYAVNAVRKAIVFGGKGRWKYLNEQGL